MRTGRPEKVSVSEVGEILSETTFIKTGDIAEYLGVSHQTIRNKVRQLRKDGIAIIHNRDGICLVEKSDMDDDEFAVAMEKFLKWILSVLDGAMTMSRPIKPLLPAMKRSLKDSLGKNERRELASACSRIVALLNYIDMEEELKELSR